MDAAVADVAKLKNKPLAQFLLDIQGPDLCVRGSEIVLNAGDVERRLRSAGAEARNSDSKRNWGRRNDRHSASWSAWVLRQSFFEVVEWNCVVIDSEPCSNHGFE